MLTNNLKTLSAAVALAMLAGCAGGGGNDNIIGDTLPELLLCAPLLICGARPNTATAAQSPPRFIASPTGGSGFRYDIDADGTIRPDPSSRGPSIYYSRAQELLQTTGTNREFLFLEENGVRRFYSLGRDLSGHPGLTYARGGGEVFSPFVDPKDPVVSQAGPGTFGVVANPFSFGWSYQSFGIWNYPAANDGTVEAKNFGGETTSWSAIPTSGGATFKGKLAGFYVSPTGTGSIAGANIIVNADFENRSLGFASNGTTLTRNTSTATSAPHLNLNGTLTYSPGANSFTGTLRNVGGTMSGVSNGQFYGPTAQELGGAFTVKSPTTVETFTGAYGAKR